MYKEYINVCVCLCESQVFQRRRDGSTDFFRDRKTYGAGFGELSNEFWLGETLPPVIHHNIVSNQGGLDPNTGSHFIVLMCAQIYTHILKYELGFGPFQVVFVPFSFSGPAFHLNT